MLSNHELLLYFKNKQMLLTLAYYLAAVGSFAGALAVVWGVVLFMEKAGPGLIGMVLGVMSILASIITYMFTRVIAGIFDICMELLERERQRHDTH